MKNALLLCLGSVVLTSAVAAQRIQRPDNLQRVSIDTPNAEEIAQRLMADGFDVLEGSITESSMQLVVSDQSMLELMTLGFVPEILEIGRPFDQIQAERHQQMMEEMEEEGRFMPPAGYANLAGVLAEMQAAAAAFPAICEYVDLTTTFGQPMTAGSRRMFAVKISDNVSIDEDEPAQLIVSDHHAREVITPVIALAAIAELTTKYGSDPTITALVDNNEIWIAPVWNPDGYNFVFTSQNLWRKNRMSYPGGIGVDLNRNYPFGWTSPCSGSSNVSSDTYKGPSPGSEVETMTMMALAESERFAKLIDYHSFGRETLWANACNPMPIDAYLQSEGILLSQASNYGNSNRRPSADGENQEWHQAQYGTHAFLIEAGTSFQPSFAAAESEAATVLPGIIYFLGLEIPLTGIVTDAITGLPVEASISYRGINFQQGQTNTSDPDTGRYYSFIPNGVRIITFSAPGYRDTCIAENVQNGTSKTRDVTMMPLAACPTATVTTRMAGPNPTVYTATPAVVGQTSTFTVDTQGFLFATIFAVACPQVRGADFGVVLIDIDNVPFFIVGPLNGPVASTTFTVTNDASMCGLTMYTQAKLHNVAARPFVVTNSQDLLIGGN